MCKIIKPMFLIIYVILFYFIYKLLYLLITMIKCTFLVSARAARSWKCNQTEFFLRVFKYPSKLYTISTPLPLLIAIPLWGLPADVGIPQLSLQTSGLWSLSSTYPRYLSEFCSILFAIAALSSITSFWVACKTWNHRSIQSNHWIFKILYILIISLHPWSVVPCEMRWFHSFRPLRCRRDEENSLRAVAISL